MNDMTDFQNQAGTGFLVVQVTTANTAIPLAGAAVTVRNEEGRVLYELRTGRDGRTERVSLPTPPRAASMAPSEVRPYAVYGIAVVQSGYENASFENVPVFDGITAVQQANLVPIPENGYPDGSTLNNGQITESGAGARLGG